MNRAGREVLLQVRPRRLARWAYLSGSVVIATMVVVGLLLRQQDLGVAFAVSDQIGLIGLGLVIGGCIMLMARPRLQVTDAGLWVRNVLGENFYPWEIIWRVAFPEGANWAQLLMPDDETHALMAIQAMDRQYAVTSLRDLRALHARYAPPAPAAPPEHLAELLRQELDRPLGRLEIIDRQLAAKQAAQRAADADPPPVV